MEQGSDNTMFREQTTYFQVRQDIIQGYSHSSSIECTVKQNPDIKKKVKFKITQTDGLDPSTKSQVCTHKAEFKTDIALVNACKSMEKSECIL